MEQRGGVVVCGQQTVGVTRRAASAVVAAQLAELAKELARLTVEAAGTETATKAGPTLLDEKPPGATATGLGLGPEAGARAAAELDSGLGSAMRWSRLGRRLRRPLPAQRPGMTKFDGTCPDGTVNSWLGVWAGPGGAAAPTSTQQLCDGLKTHGFGPEHEPPVAQAQLD